MQGLGRLDDSLSSSSKHTFQALNIIIVRLSQCVIVELIYAPSLGLHSIKITYEPCSCNRRLWRVSYTSGFAKRVNSPRILCHVSRCLAIDSPRAPSGRTRIPGRKIKLVKYSSICQSIDGGMHGLGQLRRISLYSVFF